MQARRNNRWSTQWVSERPQRYVLYPTPKGQRDRAGVDRVLSPWKTPKRILLFRVRSQGLQESLA